MHAVQGAICRTSSTDVRDADKTSNRSRFFGVGHGHQPADDATKMVFAPTMVMMVTSTCGALMHIVAIGGNDPVLSMSFMNIR